MEGLLGSVTASELLPGTAEIKQRWEAATPRPSQEIELEEIPPESPGSSGRMTRLLSRNKSPRNSATGQLARPKDMFKDSDTKDLKDLREMIRTVGPTEATILILGESGTGKELIAGSIHHSSQRREEPYVRLNCAAIPETLLESELFGHEKGSFTGAVKQKPGQVEEANGGTLFLDEIGEMSRSLQAKLLRFLEDGTFVRVGGTEELRVDVRIIAATNRDIIEAIENGDFREDLYHRLNVVQLRVSPLRDRDGDVILLAEHFLSGFGRKMNKQFQLLSGEVRHMLESHHWPGNVRELRNTMERAVILSTSDAIHPINLPDFRFETRLRKEDDSASSYEGLSLEEALASFESDMIRAELARNDKNLSRTAQKLGISRHALRYRMTRLQLTPETGTDDEGNPAAA